MSWEKLLSAKRLGRETAYQESPSAPRTEFTRDFDRLIFSSAFRRLQDKTQVFPLAKSDYVRTRLTHSLEVASVGRSLGTLAGDVIVRRDPELKDVLPQDVGAIVAAACLAHDIGNPPFGHAGEAAIQEWFCKSRDAMGWLKNWNLNEQEEQDFYKFEGNAQGFRTIGVLQIPNQRGGMQLTCAVLGTFAKYPCASNVAAELRQGVSAKKFGFTASEQGLFCELAEEVGLRRKRPGANAWYRHPLAFLVEAADDICYHVMDIEDGYKTGVLTFDEVRELHKPWLDAPKLLRAEEQIKDRSRQVEYFRATTIDSIIRSVAVAFEANLEGIIDGSFDSELVAKISRARDFSEFKRTAARRVYCARSVAEIEACGYEVIGGLLSAFMGAVESMADGGGKPSPRARTLLALLPGGDASFDKMTGYERALRVTDFVSGMTDSYAVALYQRIRGIQLP